MTEPFVIRHYDSETDDGFRPLLDLFTAVEAVDQEGLELSEAWLRAHLERPGRTRWVAQVPDNANQLIGYAWVSMQGPERAAPYALVHPDWRGQGIASALFERILRHAREAGARHLAAAANARFDAANGFLRRRGFEFAGYEWMMHASADLEPSDPVWPTGYTLKPYTAVEDAAVLADVCNASRRDMWGHGENTPGVLTEKQVPRLLSFWLPEDTFLVFDANDRAVGIVSVQPASAAGGHSIDAPTIIPSHRQHDLHLPMVFAAMHHLRNEYGPGKIRMNAYGDPPETVDIYREAGFVLDEQYIAYRYDLER